MRGGLVGVTWWWPSTREVCVQRIRPLRGEKTLKGKGSGVVETGTGANFVSKHSTSAQQVYHGHRPHSCSFPNYEFLPPLLDNIWTTLLFSLSLSLSHSQSQNTSLFLSLIEKTVRARDEAMATDDYEYRGTARDRCRISAGIGRDFH